MKTISVRASRTYEVVIGSQLLPQLGQFAAELKKSGKAAIISDSNVWPIYGQTVTDSLLAAGFQTVHFVFPAGENSKKRSPHRNPGPEVFLPVLLFSATINIKKVFKNPIFILRYYLLILYADSMDKEAILCAVAWKT